MISIFNNELEDMKYRKDEYKKVSRNIFLQVEVLRKKREQRLPRKLRTAERIDDPVYENKKMVTRMVKEIEAGIVEVGIEK